MANADTPFGLKLVGGVGPVQPRVQPYFVNSSYATALFIGDPVVKSGTSNTAVVSAVGAGTFDVGMLPEVEKCVAGTGTITGVIVGVYPTTRDSATSSAASTEAIVMVCDDPNAVYEIQADAAIAAADIGLNADPVFTHAGSTTTGLSGVELGGSSKNTTNSLQLRILRQVNRVDNEPNVIHNKVLVQINQSSEVDTATGL